MRTFRFAGSNDRLLALEPALIRDHLTRGNVRVKAHCVITSGANFNMMASRCQLERLLRCRSELTDTPDGIAIHEQLRRTWIDVENQSTHLHVNA